MNKPAGSNPHEIRDLFIDTGAALIPIPGVAPAARFFGKKLATSLAEEHGRRVSKCLKAAEELSGLSREELADVLNENEAVWPLLIRVLFKAGMTGYDPLLRAMGQAVARSLDGERELVDAELLLLAIEDLQPVHFAVLSAIAEMKAASPKTPIDPGMIAEQTGMASETIALVLGAIVSHGLVKNPYGGFGGGEYFDLNEVGKLALQAVAEATRE